MWTWSDNGMVIIIRLKNLNLSTQLVHAGLTSMHKLQTFLADDYIAYRTLVVIVLSEKFLTTLFVRTICVTDLFEKLLEQLLQLLFVILAPDYADVWSQELFADSNTYIVSGFGLILLDLTFQVLVPTIYALIVGRGAFARTHLNYFLRTLTAN